VDGLDELLCRPAYLSRTRRPVKQQRQNNMKKQITLNVEELEERIAPDSVNGVPGESNGNPGNEVSNGSSPQPGSNTRDSHGN
jgi:hypothetical protein